MCVNVCIFTNICVQSNLSVSVCEPPSAWLAASEYTVIVRESDIYNYRLLYSNSNQVQLFCFVQITKVLNMQNCFDLGKVPYYAADRVPWSIQQRCTLAVLVFFDVLRVIVMSIPFVLIDIFYMVVPRGKKCVKGQTALVGISTLKKLTG